jgi:NADPH2:quinone reductase
MKIPDGVSSRDVAAAYGQALTAHYLAFDTANLAPGKSCLVHAAAGGVGHLLVQFAKQRGATVIATVGNAQKAAFVRSLGADETILYREVDFLAAVKAITGNRGVDVVYDSVGADTSAASRRRRTAVPVRAVWQYLRARRQHRPDGPGRRWLHLLHATTARAPCPQA